MAGTIEKKDTALASKGIGTKAGVACQVRTTAKLQRRKKEGLQEAGGHKDYM